MIVEKRCFNCKHSCKSMFVIPCCNCKGAETNYSEFEARVKEREIKMKRSLKFCITGIADAMDFIMWNRKKLLDEINLLWEANTKYEMRMIMSKHTADAVCIFKNPHNVSFNFRTMTIMDIPVVFDNDVSDDFIILEVEEKEKPCIGFTANHMFFDEFIGMSKTRLNSLYGIPLDVKLKIKEVIYNPPATIIKWMDGTKTVVKCQEDEIFDKEKGFAMAFIKKALGNEGKYYDTVKKWVPQDKKLEEDPIFIASVEAYNKGFKDGLEQGDIITAVTEYVSVKEFAKIAGMAESTVRHHCGNGRIKGAVKNEEGFWRIPIDVYPERTLVEHLKDNSDELTGYPI